MFLYFEQNALATEFKEKLNNAFEHLMTSGNQVTADDLRRYRPYSAFLFLATSNMNNFSHVWNMNRTVRPKIYLQEKGLFKIHKYEV